MWSEWGSRDGHTACPSNAGTCSFPTAAVETLHAAGVTPVIWWEPTNPHGDAWTKGKFERYARILDGKHDAYIREWAIAAREAGQASGGVVLVRFAQEANGHFFPWSIGNFDNTVANYKAAWRYIWRIFKQVGARPYAKFLWSVNKQDCSNCNPFSKVYPGGKYVDYAGLTAFNWGKWQGQDVEVDGLGPRVPGARHDASHRQAHHRRRAGLALQGWEQGGMDPPGVQAGQGAVAADQGDRLPGHRSSRSPVRPSGLAPREAERRVGAWTPTRTSRAWASSRASSPRTLPTADVARSV